MTTIIKDKLSKRKVEKILKHAVAQDQRKRLDVKKYFGILKLKEDPVKIQRKLRNEWK